MPSEEPAIKRTLGPAAPAVLALLLLTAFFMLPLFGPFLILVMPVPLAYSWVRYGLYNFVAAVAVCLGFTVFGGGFPVVTTMAAAVCLISYFLADGVKADAAFDLTVLKAALAPVVVLGPVLVAYLLFAGVDPFAVLNASFERGLKESVDLYKQMGMSQADIDSVMPPLRLMKGMLVDYFPALLVCLSAVMSFTSGYLLRLHAARAGVITLPDVPLNRWAAPDHAVWGVIVPGFLLIPEVPVLRQAAGNVLGVFALVYMFQGIAVVSSVFDRFKLSWFFKALGWLLIALQPFLALAVWCAGLADTWADFRKVRVKAGK